MRHTVVISDIHLCEVEPGNGPWMRYRQRPFLPDGEIVELFDALRREARGERLTLVLNGDVFDFDAPRVVGQSSVFHDLPRDAEHGVPALAAILDDHPLFLDALGRVLDAGHEIVFVSGNHDVLLTLPEVRALLSARLVEAAFVHRSSHATTAAERSAIAARIHFRAWFHRTNDGVLVEHGHQYDPYCTYRYPMAPYTPSGRTIVPTMGSIGTRLLISRLGYFNPHVDSSCMMTKTGYILHWARYYLFSRRSLALIWAAGTARILWALFRARVGPCRARFRGNLLACARETGESIAAIGRHARLFEAPAEERLVRVVRELWVDRVFVILLGAAAGIAVLFGAGLPWGLLGLLGPFVFFHVYDRLAPKPPLAETWMRIGRVMRRIAQVHRARAVIFGHTHNPEGTWEGDTFYGNSGSWSAASTDHDGKEIHIGERPLVWLTSDDRGGLYGGLYTWRKGVFEPHVVKARPRDAGRGDALGHGRDERASNVG
jgi:UDP-2,3-diacylglucosamine pyrophosphatase LpxH